MSQPIVVSLPHRLGKAEALRRLQASLNDAQLSSGGLFLFKNQWSGDHLDFRASMLGQTTTGTIDVAEDHVRLEVQLPWLLSLLVPIASFPFGDVHFPSGSRPETLGPRPY